MAGVFQAGADRRNEMQSKRALTKFQKSLFPKLEMKSLSSTEQRIVGRKRVIAKQQPENFGRATPHKDDAGVRSRIAGFVTGAGALYKDLLKAPFRAAGSQP
jgi:hypothetical protein